MEQHHKYKLSNFNFKTDAEHTSTTLSLDKQKKISGPNETTLNNLQIFKNKTILTFHSDHISNTLLDVTPSNFIAEKRKPMMTQEKMPTLKSLLQGVKQTFPGTDYTEDYLNNFETDGSQDIVIKTNRSDQINKKFSNTSNNFYKSQKRLMKTSNDFYAAPTNNSFAKNPKNFKTQDLNPMIRDKYIYSVDKNTDKFVNLNYNAVKSITERSDQNLPARKKANLFFKKDPSKTYISIGNDISQQNVSREKNFEVNNNSKSQKGLKKSFFISNKLQTRSNVNLLKNKENQKNHGKTLSFYDVLKNKYKDPNEAKRFYETIKSNNLDSNKLKTLNSNVSDNFLKTEGNVKNFFSSNKKNNIRTILKRFEQSDSQSSITERTNLDKRKTQQKKKITFANEKSETGNKIERIDKNLDKLFGCDNDTTKMSQVHRVKMNQEFILQLSTVSNKANEELQEMNDQDLFLNEEIENIKSLNYGLYDKFKDLGIFKNKMAGNDSDEESDQDEETLKKNKKKKQMRKGMLDYLKKLRRLGLNIEECHKHDIFSKKPYQKEFSYQFIENVKLGKIHEAYRLLKKNKYLVYDFDWIHLTPLHWACKRNHENVAIMLITFKSDVNVKDILGRTPQYYALLNQNVKIVKLLLLNEASPWSSPSDCNYKNVCQNNPKVIPFLQKARDLSIVISFAPPCVRKDIWDKERNIHFIDFEKKTLEEDEFWKFMDFSAC